MWFTECHCRSDEGYHYLQSSASMDWWGQGSTAAHIVNTLLGQSNWVIVTCYDVMLAHMIDHVSSRRGIFHRVRVVEYLLPSADGRAS